MKKKVGIYNPYLAARGGGEKVCLAMAEYLSDRNEYDVHLISHENINLSDLADYFNLRLSKVTLDVISPYNKFTKLIAATPLPGGVKNILCDFSFIARLKKQSYDLFINNCYQSNLPNVGAKGIYLCMFPQKINSKKDRVSIAKKYYGFLLSLLAHLFINKNKKHPIYSYNIIIANSKYTQEYIKKYWGVSSELLYPICEDMSVMGSKKKKIILNVGRFSKLEISAHHKRQDVLVDAFIQMEDLHEDGWQLHLAGSAWDEPGTQKYVVKMMEKSQGYPIFFHTNYPFENLKSLFSEASIYWHATGYGSNPEELPEKQEHFGITTVEAMSTGAIPIVINRGGQSEIIENNKNGYLWSNLEELIKYTNLSIRSKHISPSVVKNSSQEFFVCKFNEKFGHILDQI